LKEQPAGKDDDGRSKLYADIAHPINSACREMIQQRVIQAFEDERTRSKLPGYVPSYDDFDHDEVPLAAPRAAAAVSPAQIQGAEKPRGPHKPPSQQTRVDRPHDRGFGAGIFDGT
jgi:stage V sporulation protein G